MSLRPNAMREEAARFSLNQFFDSNAVMHAAPEVERRAVQIPAHTAATFVAKPKSLAFTITNQTLGTRASVPSQGFARDAIAAPIPQLTFALGSKKMAPAAVATTPNMAIDLNRRIPAGYVHGGQDNTGEVMRLTALLEDSRVKLDRVQTKLTASETSVCRANNALTSERATAKARLAQMANELRTSREMEQKLRVELSTTPTATKAVHDAEAFRIKAEGAIHVSEENEQLKAGLQQREKEVVEMTKAFETLKVEHAALQASHDSISEQLGAALAAHESMQSVQIEETQALGAAEYEKTIQAMQLAADERVAAEVAAESKRASAASELAVSEAVEQAQREMTEALESKLEKVEKREAKTERKLLERLETTQNELKVAKDETARAERRAQAAEEFVTMATETKLSGAKPGAGAVAVDAAVEPPTVSEQADTSAPAAVGVAPPIQNVFSGINDSTAVTEYRKLIDEVDSLSTKLNANPNSLRNQMRLVAATTRAEKTAGALLNSRATHEPMHTASSVPNTHSCCNHHDSSDNMNTKAYPTCASPLAAADIFGLDLGSATGMHAQNVGTSTEVQARTGRLVKATQQDVVKMLTVLRFEHQVAEGSIKATKTAAADPTGCGMYTPQPEEVSKKAEEDATQEE